MHAQTNHAMPAERPRRELIFLSPDRAQAQRVTTRLRNLGHIHWESSPSPAQVASRGGSAVMLVDFSSAQAAESTRLVQDLALIAPGTAVIAVGSTANDGSSGVLAAMRAGVRDFIDLDAANLDDARLAVEHAQEQAASQAPHETKHPPTPAHGRTILLLGVRPGIGTSTLAAHLGVMAQQHPYRTRATPAPDNHVLVLDLGEPGGDVALYLDSRDDFHVEDAIGNAYRMDATLARTAIARHHSNLAVLSRPLDTAIPSDADQNLGLLLNHLEGLFSLVLVDGGGIPARLLSTTLINQADEIWLIADQAIATVVSLDNMLTTLRHCGADRNRFQLVVNRHVADCGMTPQQIAERFKLPLLATLPERGTRLRTSANMGKLLSETHPGDRYIQSIKPLLDCLWPDILLSASHTRTSLLGRMRKHLRI